MSAPDRVDADVIRRHLNCFSDALRSHQERLNRLNVYPVPDGDTGTNMALTVQSVVAEMADAEDMASLVAAVAHGSLMGARGNSGVILSQILRGLTSGFGDGAAVDAATLADSLGRAATAAYEAVMRPVEGTILTVAREAAEAARARAGAGGTLLEVVEAAHRGAESSLARTPQLLAVLAEAGVVDAGGAGYVLFLEALREALGGDPVSAAEAHSGAEATDGAQALAAGGSDREPPPVSELRYEVMFLLDAPDAAIDSFKQAWSEIGDSIVVVGGDGLWNCHIHSDDVGASIEAAIGVGRPHQIRVTDLAEQVAEEAWVRDAVARAPSAAAVEVSETAVVAVGVGPGIEAIFESLGAGAVVPGGASMNPSTAELLEAVERVPARSVILLPNNSNVVAVAESAVGLASRPVRVLPTRGVPEGFAALIGFDPNAGCEDNLVSMKHAAAAVAWGEVTWAVRDANTPVGPARAGDHLGLAADRIVAVGTELLDVTCAVVDALATEAHELCTLVSGARAESATTEAIVAELVRRRPALAVEVHEGGQPLSVYLVSVE